MTYPIIPIPIRRFPAPDSLQVGLLIWLLDPIASGNKARAADLIVRARSEKLEDLDLSFLNLSELPPAMFDDPTLQGCLKTLTLNTNRLRNIPEGISKFTNLTELHVADNQLQDITEELLELRNLSTLDLDYNQIRSLPDWIGALEELVILSCIHNQLTELPNSLADLSNLEQLYLENNPLNTFSDPIQNFLIQFQDNHELDIHIAGDPISSEWKNKDLIQIQLNRLPERLKELVHLYITLLQRSQDYRNGGEGKDALIVQTEQMIGAALENQPYQERVTALLEEATTACDDRALMFASDIELERRIHVERMDLKQIGSLLIGSARLLILEAKIGAVAEERNLGDLVEIVLGARLQLADRLSLPITTHAMHYPAMVILTREEIEAIGNTVMEETSNPQAILSTHPIWKMKVKEKFKNRFRDLNTFQVELARVLSNENLNSQNLQDECKRIVLARTDKENKLIEEITEELFSPHPAARAKRPRDAEPNAPSKRARF